MNRTAERGFTLVELLIALVLTGMIMALLFGGLRITSRSWDAVEQRRQQITEQYQLQQLLRRLIGQAQTLRVRDRDSVIQVAFRGEADQLTFVAPRYAGSRGGAELWYRLYLSEATAERPQALMLETRGYSSGEAIDWFLLFDPAARDEMQAEPILPPEQHLLLVTGDARLRFTYHYHVMGAPERIEEQWLEEARLPTMVEINLETLFGGEGESDGAGTPLLTSWDGVSIALQEYDYAVRTD